MSTNFDMIPLYENLAKDLFRSVVERDYRIIRAISSEIQNLTIYNGFTEFVDLVISEATDCDDEEIFKLFVNYIRFGKPNETHLKNAILKGKVAVVELLLSNGVRLENTEWICESSVIYSSIFSRTKTRKDMLKLLVEYDLVEPGVKFDSVLSFLDQFLYSFVLRDDADAAEFAKICIDHKLTSDDLKSEQFYSISTGNIPLITLLIDKGPRLNDMNAEPLMHAANCQYSDVVELLLSRGANINFRDNLGNSVLHLACSSCQAENISFFLQKGIDVNIKNFNGHTAFYSLDPEAENYNKCLIIMIKELAKLIFDNVTISEDDIKLIQSESKDREHFEKSKSELSRLESIKFYSRYSYYSLLKKTINKKKLALLTKNQEVVTEFENNLHKFPYYKDDIYKIFYEAVKIRIKSDEVITKLYYIFGDTFPDTVIRKLSENLTCEDLPVM